MSKKISLKELQAKCKDLNLKTYGKKDDLIKRIRNHENRSQANDDSSNSLNLQLQNEKENDNDDDDDDDFDDDYHENEDDREEVFVNIDELFDVPIDETSKLRKS